MYKYILIDVYICIYIYICMRMGDKRRRRASGGQQSSRKGPADSGHRSAGCRPWVRQIA